MNDDNRFDALTKRLGAGGVPSHSRRGVLQGGLTLGAVALAALSGLRGRRDADASGSSASPDGRPSRFRNQQSTNDPAIQAKAFALDYDIDKIFRFVADEVDYEPYAGVLRGAKGTLWALAGNSADKALLLAALLEEALVPVRFVTGAIDDAAVAALQSAVETSGGAGRLSRAFAAPSADGNATPVSTSTATPDTMLDQPALAKAAIQMTKDRLADGVRTIHDALRAASIDLPFTAPPFPDSERTERVWVQAADGAEWRDMDAVLPSSTAGTRPAEPGEPLAALPERMQHTLTFRLVAETMTGGALSRSELLNHNVASKDLTGEQLLLVHQPPADLQGVGLALNNAVGSGMQSVPLLAVGQDLVQGAMLSFATGGGALGALGSDGPNDGDTTAEWLEIDIETPNGGKTTAVREIFDRIGLERRAVGAAIDTAQIPALPLTDIGDGKMGYLPLLATLGIAVSTGLVPATVFQADVSGSAMFSNLALIGHACNAVRELMAPSVLPDYGLRAYLHEPNVAAFIITAEELQKDGGRLRAEIDLLHRAYTPVVAKGQTPATNPMVALGVYSHVIERAMVTPLTPPPVGLPPVSTGGVGAVFEQGKAAGIPVRVLRASADSASLAVGADAKIRIAASLAAGRIVVTPAASVAVNGVQRTGWWEIDPASGATVDVMDDGGRQTEYAALLRAIASLAANPLVRVGTCVAAVFFFASALLNAAAAGVTAAEGSMSGTLNNLGSATASVAETAVAGTACAA
ncbi:MAG: hypothetical protein ACR2OO_05270 [Thermomicrobiales bacterium]